MSISVNFSYQVNPDIISPKRTFRTQVKTPESIKLGQSSGVGATCCAILSLDEAASSAINPDSQSANNGENLHSEFPHIPSGSEIPTAFAAGYLSLGGIIATDQVARQNAATQKSLSKGVSVTHNYAPDQSTIVNFNFIYVDSML